MGKLCSHRMDPVQIRPVENTVIEALQVEYEASKEAVETPFFNLVGEVFVDIILQERWTGCWWGVLKSLPTLINLWTHLRNERLEAGRWSRQGLRL